MAGSYSLDVMAALSVLEGTGRVTTPLRNTQREALLDLLGALTNGRNVTTDPLVGEQALIGVYECTLQRGEQEGRKLAQSVRERYKAAAVAPTPYAPAFPSVNPLRDKSDYIIPYGTPNPQKPPEAPSDYVTKREFRSLESEVRRDLSSTRSAVKSDMSAIADKLREDTTATLLKVTEAFPEAVKYHVKEALAGLTPVTLSVVQPNAAPVVLGMVHRKTPQIIKMLAANVNVYLFGPAGSGKTTVGRKCAEAFGLPFYFAAKVESEYMLLGFKDARGETVRTQFREAYEHGGVFLFDELDGSSPSAVVALNAALANGICPFPDGVVHRHENFKCIAAGNTKLTGANREYVGRSQLDAASIDRFAFVEFDYDDALETALASNANWCRYVQDARRAVKERALKHLITPRATYDGCKLLDAGLSWAEVEDAVLWKGLEADTVKQLKGTMKEKAPVPLEPEKVEIL